MIGTIKKEENENLFHWQLREAEEEIKQGKIAYCKEHGTECSDCPRICNYGKPMEVIN